MKQKIATAGLLFSLAVAFYSGIGRAENRAETILCQESDPDAVQMIPAPFDQWVVVLCTDEGQALAPEIGTTGILWVRHNTMEPFMLGALPPILTPAKKAKLFESVSAENFRFTAFSGGVRRGRALVQTTQMFAITFEDVDLDKFDDVYQLDATSVYNGMIYNLFFYTKNDVPQHLIVCFARCQASLGFDILTLDQAKQRIELFEQEKL